MSKRRQGRCEWKTRTGNVFTDKAEADLQAQYKSEKYKDTLIAYQCDVCNLYHIGNVKKMQAFNRKDEQGNWVRKKSISIRRDGQGGVIIRYKRNHSGGRPDKFQRQMQRERNNQTKIENPTD